MYADDTQLYITFDHDQSEMQVAILEMCLMNIKNWMTEFFLKLNEDKTQLLVIPSKKTVNPIDISVTFNGSQSESLNEAKNLGVYFDNNSNMSKQVKHIVSTGYYHLRNLWSIGSMLPKELKIKLVHSFVLSRIDYCNSCLYGIRKCEMDQLQKLMNSAVRFIFNLIGDRYRDHITPYLEVLHFLQVEYRIKFKIALMAYRCINNFAPIYLKQLLTPKEGLQSLRMSSDCFRLNIPKLPKT